MKQMCRYQFGRKQGLAEKGLQPCGECGRCTNYGLHSLDAESVAGEVHAALADDDRVTADRVLRRAVHLGVEPVDLFLAGGKPAAKRKTAKAPTSAETTGDGS